MRIAQINLPLFDNDGASLASVHENLQRDLCTIFGGYTVTEGQGAWMDGGKLYAEPVAIYQVAYDHRVTADQSVIDAAQHYGRAAKQIAVFYVIDGKATIADIE